MVESQIEVVPATADRWNDVVELFGTRGDAAHCWCQWFVSSSSYGKPEAKQALHAQMEQATPPGLVAYVGGVPVGWLRVNPLVVLPGMTRSRAFKQWGAALGADLAGIWMMSCFVVKVGHRRQGVARVLLRDGIAFARDHGARRLLARPIDLSARPKTSSAELFVGTLSTFLDSGFHEVARLRPYQALVEMTIEESR
ncbi:MAG: GNAT family N-acetyltransferase [Propionibacteriaceae bacterium]|jgi:GNAT superfamily N-acetyltransferase|nr:GNAT family N-acetyltransferase [Propionibacteriaceae bacterium]